MYQSFSPFMAEKPGFEPGRHLSHPTPLAGEPLRPLGYFSKQWRRERDSNPRCLATSLVFKTSALNHSAISPDRTSEIYYTRALAACQPPFVKILAQEERSGGARSIEAERTAGSRNAPSHTGAPLFTESMWFENIAAKINRFFVEKWVIIR